MAIKKEKTDILFGFKRVACDSFFQFDCKPLWAIPRMGDV